MPEGCVIASVSTSIPTHGCVYSWQVSLTEGLFQLTALKLSEQSCCKLGTCGTCPNYFSNRGSQGCVTMSSPNKRLCQYTEQRGLLFAGLYLWLSALYNIVITEWDHKQTVLFLQGESAEEIETEVLEALLTALNFACVFQMVSVTFGLIPGALLGKRCLIVGWIWLCSFQLAVYITYWFAGAMVYCIVGDGTKVILLLYGFVNILVGMCAWKMAFNYVRDAGPSGTIHI